MKVRKHTYSDSWGDWLYGKGAKKDGRLSWAEWKEPIDRTREGLRRAVAAARASGLNGEEATPEFESDGKPPCPWKLLPKGVEAVLLWLLWWLLLL